LFIPDNNPVCGFPEEMMAGSTFTQDIQKNLRKGYKITSLG
jgi:hypothetical protein